jgi:hypothetical protein
LAHFAFERGVELCEVIREEVVDFRGDFYSRGTAAHDDDVEEFALSLITGSWQGGEFEELFDSRLETFGVVDVAHEVGVFDGSGGVEGVGYAAGKEMVWLDCDCSLLTRIHIQRSEMLTQVRGSADHM